MIRPDSPKILIVDDTRINLKILTDLLFEHGYQVCPVSSGAMALQAVVLEKPDLIMLDVVMPEMDGYEVCRRLKLDECSRDIPVIFISALGEAVNKVIGFKAGGVDYITRPFQEEVVLVRVESHLALSRLQQQIQARNAQLEREVVQRKKAEEELLRAHGELERRVEELRESGERFRWIFDNSPAMISIVSMVNQQYVEVNSKFLNVLGYNHAEVVGQTPKELALLVDFERVKHLNDELLNKREIFLGEYRLKGKSGKIITVQGSASLAHFSGEKCWIIIARDITKEKELENDLLRLDRLNLVGEMAASIGHEVRNPMTTVRGYLQLFQTKQENHKYLEQIKVMIEELDRANFIITEFLSLARNKAVKLKFQNLNQIVNAILPLLQADALHTGHNLEIKLGELPDIMLDDKEIRQMLLNLAKNGFEAMEAGGTLTIESYHKNNTIVLAVRDTGKGFSSVILDKLGTPFITTKDTGTGLGIPVCYRIAERHGAKIEVNTGLDGTVISVRFPCR
ncbi:MAG: response regulator [Pelosinus sp.]|nr:response regulator [Pelosinus sp.]